MDSYQTKDLFQLQAELIDTKVNIAVSKAIDRVIEQISNLKHEVHVEIRTLYGEIHTLSGNLNNQMNKQFSSLRHLELELASLKDSQREFRNQFISYFFKASWLFIVGTISYATVHFFGFVK